MKSGTGGIMDKLEILKQFRELAAKDDIVLAFTSAMTEFSAAIEEEDININDIVAIVERDPLLTASLLKLANSSYFGFTKKVSTVKHAVSVIGLKSLKEVFTASVFKSAFIKKNDVYIDQLWKHSLGTAVAAQVICRKWNKDLCHDAFIAGLLHDLGSFLIHQYFPHLAETITNIVSNDPNKRLLIAERKVMGLKHTEVGAFFAKEWQFPSHICNAIKHHHYLDTSQGDKQFCAIIMIANNFAKAMELGESENLFVEPIPRWIWSLLGIEISDLVELVREIQENFFATLAYIE